MKDKELMTKLVVDFNATLKENNLIGVMIVGKENCTDIITSGGGTAKQAGKLIAVATAKFLHYFEQYGEDEDFVKAVTALKKADASVTATVMLNAKE